MWVAVPMPVRLLVGSSVTVTATQSAVDVHETPEMASVGTATAPGLDQAVAPPAGLVEVKSRPVWVPATHRVVFGHERALKWAPVTLALVHALAPPAGLWAA